MPRLPPLKPGITPAMLVNRLLLGLVIIAVFWWLITLPPVVRWLEETLMDPTATPTQIATFTPTP
jgi:hypothetical protein